MLSHTGSKVIGKRLSVLVESILMKLQRDGFEIIEHVITTELRDSLIEELAEYSEIAKSGCVRNSEKKLSLIDVVTESRGVQKILETFLEGKTQLIRAIVFDKSSTANWLVPWHQDKTVAVDRKVDVPGWGPWSIKEGVQHVQPPIDVLESILTIRIHLDDTTVKNGCVKVIPGSHKQRILDQDEILEMSRTCDPYYCEVPAGGALVMRPLIVHSSSKSESGERRRVLHLEYSSYHLGCNLRWAVCA